MKFTNFKKLAVGFVGSICLQSASAIVLVNGDFEDATQGSFGGNANGFRGDQVDTGWVGTRNGWSIAGGVATRTGSNANSQPLVQVASVPPTLAGNQFVLAFDWTPAAGATGTALDISVITSGFTAGADPLPTTQSFFGGLNFSTPQTRTVGGAGGSNLDLIDGVTSGGNRNTSRFVATGTAGTTSTVQVPLNFATNNIEDFDFLGLRFEVGDSAATGGFIDNVRFEAIPIPEPSSVLLLSLGSLAFIRRKRS